MLQKKCQPLLYDDQTWIQLLKEDYKVSYPEKVTKNYKTPIELYSFLWLKDEIEKIIKKEAKIGILKKYQEEWNKLINKFELNLADESGEPIKNYKSKKIFKNETTIDGSLAYEFGKGHTKSSKISGITIFPNYYSPFGSEDKMDMWRDNLETKIREFVGDKYEVIVDYDSDFGYQGITFNISL